MSGSIEGQWKLMGSENFTEFTTVMSMYQEILLKVNSALVAVVEWFKALDFLISVYLIF